MDKYIHSENELFWEIKNPWQCHEIVINFPIIVNFLINIKSFEPASQNIKIRSNLFLLHLTNIVQSNLNP